MTWKVVLNRPYSKNVFLCQGLSLRPLECQASTLTITYIILTMTLPLSTIVDFKFTFYIPKNLIRSFTNSVEQLWKGRWSFLLSGISTPCKTFFGNITLCGVTPTPPLHSQYSWQQVSTSTYYIDPQTNIITVALRHKYAQKNFTHPYTEYSWVSVTL